MLKEQLADLLAVPEDMITRESSLKEDLNIDSIQSIELIFNLRVKYDMEIPNTILEKMKSVGDLEEYLKDKIPDIDEIND